MALTATIYKLEVQLSDVDRGVYETLELRLARHPSETMRYLLTRALAYCLNHEEGIAFSKGGLSDADDPPIAIKTLDGRWTAWIDVGQPSADRLHKAAKAAPRVAVWTSHDPAFLREEATKKGVHKGDQIDVVRIDPAFLDALEPKIGKSTKLELTRTDGTLYVTVAGETTSTALETTKLLAG
jgi:uncharacterized protein YaeQ